MATKKKLDRKEYKKQFNKRNYDVIRADVRKGLRPALEAEFEKDGHSSFTQGLTKLFTDFLEGRGYDIAEITKKRD